MENNKIYGLLGLSMKAGKIVFGTESTIDMINKNKVKLIILAKDTAKRQPLPQQPPTKQLQLSAR